MTIHPSITEARIVNAVKRDNGTGFCIACGRKAKGFIEPDAEHYPCEFKKCSSVVKPIKLFLRVDGLDGTVYGAEQLLLMTVA